MRKILILACLSVFFSNCKHHSLEQQTIEALHGKWELYETRGVDAQGNEVKVKNDLSHISMQLLSPWYGGDTGLNFINNTEVDAKFRADWTSFAPSTYSFKTPNKLTFTLTWADKSPVQVAEILRLDAKELWLKRVTIYPSVGDEIRLKRVQ